MKLERMNERVIPKDEQETEALRPLLRCRHYLSSVTRLSVSQIYPILHQLTTYPYIFLPHTPTLNFLTIIPLYKY